MFITTGDFVLALNSPIPCPWQCRLNFAPSRSWFRYGSLHKKIARFSLLLLCSAGGNLLLCVFTASQSLLGWRVRKGTIIDFEQLLIEFNFSLSHKNDEKFNFQFLRPIHSHHFRRHRTRRFSASSFIINSRGKKREENVGEKKEEGII